MSKVAAKDSGLTRSEGGGPASRGDVDLSLAEEYKTGPGLPGARASAGHRRLVRGFSGPQGYPRRLLLRLPGLMRPRRRERQAGETNYLDLTRSAGREPSSRADVHVVDSPLFEKFVIKLEIRPPGVSVEVTARAASRSPLSNAGAALLLAAGGCLCSYVLHLIGAPGWASLAAVVLPWVIARTFGPMRLRKRTL